MSKMKEFSKHHYIMGKYFLHESIRTFTIAIKIMRVARMVLS